MKHLLNKFNRQKVEIVVIQTFLSSKVILDCVITTWVFYQKREDGTDTLLVSFFKSLPNRLLQMADFETEKERRNDSKDAIKPRLHLFVY